MNGNSDIWWVDAEAITRMQIDISNNYEPEQVSRKGAGIGLKNVNNRLMLIYGRDDLVKVEKAGNEFRVRLLIPQAEGQKKRAENPARQI